MSTSLGRVMGGTAVELSLFSKLGRSLCTEREGMTRAEGNFAIKFPLTPAIPNSNTK